MAAITIDPSAPVESYVELVVERLGMSREEVVHAMLEQYIASARAPGRAPTESEFQAALQHTLTKHDELYRRLARHVVS